MTSSLARLRQGNIIKAMSEALSPPPGRRFVDRPWLPLAVLLSLYAALLLPTLSRQGISWDEQNDLWIAQAYFQPGGWLVGSDIDPSQARLPMFVTALVYGLLGRADLLTGRWVSALVGGLTLVGVYVYARRRFGLGHAVLAAGLLAVSPFYLSFGRVAFTETDIYLACAAIWLLDSLDRLIAKPTLGRAALTGVWFGLALSTKFTALAFLPGIWYALRRAALPHSASPATSRQALLMTVWLAIAGLGSWDFGLRFPPQAYSLSVRAAHYGFTLLAWLLPLAWAARQRSQVADWRALAGFVTALGLLTFFVLPPEHLTNPEILKSLFWRAENEMAFDPAFIGEAAGLHLACIFFKSTPLIGLLMLAGWIAAALRWRQEANLEAPFWLASGYFAGLLILPIAQTFYTVPILPFLAIFAARLFWQGWQVNRRWAGVFGALTLLVWGIELIQCYPDYNLNGYQWLGVRTLFRRSTVGYRSVVQTPSDGVQQAIEWINAHAKPGESVQVYALEWHIVYAAAGEPVYRLESGFEETLNSKPDYVVIHINTLIRQSWYIKVDQGDLIRYPYDPIKLGREYEKVFSVRRAFGLEMATVWKRKE